VRRGESGESGSAGLFDPPRRFNALETTFFSTAIEGPLFVPSGSGERLFFPSGLGEWRVALIFLTGLGVLRGQVSTNDATEATLGVNDANEALGSSLFGALPRKDAIDAIEGDSLSDGGIDSL
jgi:hypothetical protein